MTTDELERYLRTALRETLDGEVGPQPAWAGSPAARRLAALDGRPHLRRPLRLLAVAAVLAIAGGAALLAGAPRPLDVPAAAVNGWIAFTVAQDDPAGGDADLDIWFVALDKEPRRVIGTDADGVDQLCPAFSPDARSLSYGQVEGDDADGSADDRTAALVVADVAGDGSVADRLRIDVGDGLPPPCPVWSPDGRRIAFGVPRTSPRNPTTSSADSEVWVVTLEDRGITVLPDLLATDLEWSPDGSILAISSGVDDRVNGETLRDARIFLHSIASGTTRPLGATVGGAGALTWSPDGRRIAYATGDYYHVLRVVDVETAEDAVLTPLFAAARGIGPVWSPDGETIAYERSRWGGETSDVVLVTPDDRSAQTGYAREVVIRKEDNGHKLAIPTRVTWSPDSKYLLYLGWTHPNGCCSEDFFEVMSLVAVPTDRDAESILLADFDGVVGGDGSEYDTTLVPIQTWGRQPSD